MKEFIVTITLYHLIMFFPAWIILISYGFNKAIAAYKERHREAFDKCFEEHIGEHGKCYGVYGGDKFTDHISYSCLDCPYLSIITEDELWDLCGKDRSYDSTEQTKIHYYIKKGYKR